LRTRRKKVRSRAAAVVIFLCALSGAWLFQARLEGGNPSLVIKEPIDAIGISRNVSISVADEKSGLRRLEVSLLKDGKKVDLVKKRFPYAGFAKGGKVKNEAFTVLIEPEKLGFSDGRAELRASAVDYSWRRFFRGNRTYIQKDVNIDTRPPRIKVISKRHDLIQGGAGLVIYRISEPCLRSGVRVGDRFYPGYAGYFEDKSVFMSFLALSHNQGPGTVIFAEAVDLAGNRSKAGFPYYIIRKDFKRDRIHVSDAFINRKMPEFATEIPGNIKTSPADHFLFVNRNLRKANSALLLGLCAESDPAIHWSGSFLRLPGSVRRAGFADYRSYQYKGRTIDYQIHFGIDLASVAKAGVPAANAGRVAAAGSFGIYGKTVVIDHGHGLFSLYAHLSQMYVRKDQMIKKGDVIGQTGKTGLAAGDHLHFGMMLNGAFVNPVEWWDSVWLKKNIEKKMEKAGLPAR
jgi:murein DD-endopeptidase MepM/ murein hydrolase activator NlpD